MSNSKYRSIVKLDFQYAHRFMNYPGEPVIFMVTRVI
jgi:6-pyruvoyltetrahydropterin/6-carboxytetrahydropterin synthase